MKKYFQLVFIAIVSITIVLVCVFLNQQTNDDIFYNEMDGFITFIILTPILIVEAEVYSFSIYLFTSKKSTFMTIFKTLCLVVCMLFFSLTIISLNITSNKFSMLPLFLLLLYLILKVVGLIKYHKTDN